MIKFFHIFLIVGLLASCQNEEEVDAPNDIEWSKENSTDLNKEIAVREKIDIQFFLERHPTWRMEETGSGLFFFKYEVGTGEFADAHREVQVQFEIGLLDGTSCYKTEDDEVEEFKIDHSNVESGIQEAIKLMQVGDRAKLIIPSHLAHGLTGDNNKIPPLTALVVDLYLYKIVR